jgi:putative Mg2+ transporter-C (MgtC) family protein
MGAQEQLVLVARVALALVLGYLVGLERARRGKDAGERTFALVSAGAAAFVAVGLELFPVTGDRVIQGVVAGIGFLGAGIIFRAEGGTRGLTTAAASWATAAVGVLAGAGMYLAAPLVAVLTIAVLESRQIRVLREVSRGEDEEHEEHEP